MKWIKKFTLFEEEPQTFTFDELSQEAKKNAIQNVREEMWEGRHGADDISSWVIDDDFIFEPTHDEMLDIFGPNYNDSLDGNPMIANDRDDISYISKEDQNYYLHCKKALNVTNDGMFLGFLGIPPYFWDDINYYFVDSGTYTKIEFEIENEDEMDSSQLSRLNSYLDKASDKFKKHMDSVLTRITRDIEDQYEDEQIEDRIESNDIIFDSEGNTL
jgi:predicted RNA-binding protein with PUA-like domain